MRGSRYWLAGLACAGIVVGTVRGVRGADAPIAASVAGASQEKAALDLTYIPKTAVGAVVVRPQPVFTGPGSEWLPLEVITAGGLANAGFDPVKISEAVAVFTAKTGPRPEVGIILRFTEPYSKPALLAKLPHDTTDAEVAGKTFQRAGHDFEPSYYLPDAQTVLIAPEPMLRQMLAAISGR